MFLSRGKHKPVRTNPRWRVVTRGGLGFGDLGLGFGRAASCAGVCAGAPGGLAAAARVWPMPKLPKDGAQMSLGLHDSLGRPKVGAALRVFAVSAIDRYPLGETPTPPRTQERPSERRQPGSSASPATPVPAPHSGARAIKFTLANDIYDFVKTGSN